VSPSDPQVTSTPQLAWMDGEFIPFGQARIHVRSDCVMRGGSVFEGIPAYWSEQQQQLWIFRFDDHFSRLARSMKILRMNYALDELKDATIELARRSHVRQDVHLRPTVAFGLGPAFGYRPEDMEMNAFVTVVPFPRNEIHTDGGLRLAVSSWQRISDVDQPPRVKSSANYLNGRLAQTQARYDGYDGAILLNRNGYVSEGPASCLGLIRDGELLTPRVTDGVLEGITRATVLDLATESLGIKTTERAVDRTELYIADELFECGSAHEITPIVSVDGFEIGDGTPGPITRQLMTTYNDVVHGVAPERQHWLTPVYPSGEGLPGATMDKVAAS